MKKIITTFLFLIALSGASIAQDKGYFGLSVGPSFPMGDFADTDSSNTDAGYATTGYSIDLNGGYKIGKSFGVAALLRYNSWGYADDAFSTSISAGGVGASVSVNATQWKLFSAMIGPYGSFDLSDKLSLDARFLLGFGSANSPEIKFRSDVFGIVTEINVPSYSGSGLAYNIGAGLRIHMNDKLSLLTNLDYLGSNVSLETPGEATDVSIGALNFGVGLGYRF